MTIDLDKLKAAALAAGGDQWAKEGFEQIVGNGNFYGGLILAGDGHSIIAQCVMPPNADFIEAASPAAVLELIAEIERLRTQEHDILTMDPQCYVQENASLKDHVRMVTADNERLRTQAGAVRFAGHVLKAHRNDGYPSDVDGDYLKDLALKCGLIESFTATCPCGERCSCAEAIGFGEDPIECLRNTEAGKAAMRAAADSSHG